MKFKNYISAILLACILLCSFSLVAFSQEIPNHDLKGKLTVEMESDGKAVTGGILSAFRIGKISEENGIYSFVKTGSMEAFTGTYTDIESPQLAEDIFSFVAENNLPAYATAENENAKAVFSDLELGLYLIVQTKNSDGFEPLKAFLVSIPINEDGHYVYDVTAKGKFSPTQNLTTTDDPNGYKDPSRPTNPNKPSDSNKPTKPIKPIEPTIPRTGQLKWPIPIFTALGLALFSLGWALRFVRRKNDNEE